MIYICILSVTIIVYDFQLLYLPNQRASEDDHSKNYFKNLKNALFS